MPVHGKLDFSQDLGFYKLTFLLSMKLKLQLSRSVCEDETI